MEETTANIASDAISARFQQIRGFLDRHPDEFRGAFLCFRNRAYPFLCVLDYLGFFDNIRKLIFAFHGKVRLEQEFLSM